MRLNVGVLDWASSRKLQDQQRFTMALTVQNPLGLTSIQCHTPFVPTVTETACLAADTGRFAEIDCHTPFVPTETDTACLESETGRLAAIDLKKTQTTRIFQDNSPPTRKGPNWTSNE